MLSGASALGLKRISTGTPDTLEIFAFKVEFKSESPDNSLTTGLGTFGSDADTAGANYSLDPKSSRASSAYWEKHFEFARNYFLAASGGKLVIESQVFPQSGSQSYKLDKHIIDYNRTTRSKTEKSAAFDSSRAVDYLAFVWDAVHQAHTDSASSPFTEPLLISSNRYRVYMIIHAGASRLVDGGTMGTQGADTPGDFMDNFVTKESWKYLRDDADRRADTNGIVLQGASIDTLRDIMVLSETASQDGLNWGINGILVSQIAQQIGMPITYDAVKGISRLGYFDMMDFAGYNAGNGFLPVLPSAWLRVYMGWAKVRELRPGYDLSEIATLYATGSGLGDEILKIPLSANEYLLLENRQRAQDSTGKVLVELDDGSSRTVIVDSLQLLFQDSVCNDVGASCKRNTKKAKGIIQSVSSYDAGLPGSGVAVWHVNEWFLRRYLSFYGSANFWAGDTLRDHWFGLGLVEADGIPSLGKEFKNALGQPAFDFGSGADLLPHLSYGGGVKHDTIDEILPTGYANTASTLGGLSGIQVTVAVPKGSPTEKSVNSFMGDSVVNWRASKINVKVQWNNQAMANSKWPRQTIDSINPSQILFAQKPTGVVNGASHFVIAGSKDGSLQIFAPNGDTVTSAHTTVLKDRRFLDVQTMLETVQSIDSAVSIPVYRLGNSAGTLLGIAAQGTDIYSLHTWQFAHTQLTAVGASLGFTRMEGLLGAVAKFGPMIHDQGVWMADFAGLHKMGLTDPPQWKLEKQWPTGFVPQQMAVCGDVDEDKKADVAVVGSRGTIAILNSANGTFTTLTRSEGQLVEYQMACTDFNRDGSPDAFVLGNNGFGWIVDLRTNNLISPVRNYRRGTDGDTLQYSDKSPLAIGDINGDKLPDAVFYGHNLVYAIDSSGVPLQGFPVRLTRGTPEFGMGESPLIVNVDGKGNPEILVGTPSGKLYAIASDGKLLTSGWPRLLGEFDESLDPMGLAVGAVDSVPGLEIFSSHRDYLHGNGLEKATTAPGANWLMAGGGLARQSYFDASSLGESSATTPQNTIKDFIVFPNPVKGGKAKIRFELGAMASKVTLSLFDLAGNVVLRKSFGKMGQGRNQLENIDVSTLGSDIYAVSLEVVFSSGKKATAWDRIGLVR